MELKDVQVHIHNAFLVITSKEDSHFVAHIGKQTKVRLGSDGHSHWWKDDKSGNYVCTLLDLAEALKAVKHKKDKENEN